MSVMVTSEVRSDGRSDDELEVNDSDEHIFEGGDNDFSDLSSVLIEEKGWRLSRSLKSLHSDLSYQQHYCC